MKTGICIFAFNRFESIKDVFFNLANQNIIEDFDIHLFIDGPKCSADVDTQKKIMSLANCLFMDKLTIHSRSVNVGLRENIIEGINFITKEYANFLVLEDDTVLAPGALNYVSAILAEYFHSPSVMHINLWNHFGTTSPEPYFSEHMHCWGWASWSDRWPSDLREVLSWDLSFSEKIRLTKWFSTSHYSHFYGNKIGVSKTWAILWMVYIIRCKGFIVSPPVSLIKNIGLDGGSNVESVVRRQQEFTLINSDEFSYGDILPNRFAEFASWINNFRITSKLSLLKNLFLVLFK